MELSVRISERLDFLQMSQAELARRAGIPQSTVNSLLKRPRRSSPHLLRIARELQTTPEYLVGETDDPNSDQPDFALSLSAEEREWIDLLRAAEPEDRRAIIRLTRTAASAAPRTTVHEPALDYKAPAPDEGAANFWDEKLARRPRPSAGASAESRGAGQSKR